MVKKIIQVSFILCLALVASLALFSENASVAAEECTPCTGSFDVMGWGTGPDCDTAEDDALADAFSKANAQCGFRSFPCNTSYVITAPCWWNASKGAYQVDLRFFFGCRECDLSPEEPPYIP